MKRGVNVLLSLASIVVTLLIAELILRIVDTSHSVRYAVWPPDLDQVIVPDERDTPGISETHHFRITKQGYRGRPIGSARLRILAFGGSTTESLFVPEARSWPRLLELALSHELNVPTWIGNFGKSGRNTRQHILDAKYVLPEFPAQVALFLVGANNLGLVVGEPAILKPITLQEIESDEYVHKSLLVLEDKAKPRIRLVGLVDNASRAIANRLDPKAQTPHWSTEFYRQRRKMRLERAGFTSEVPDLTPWLDEYARNLSRICALVRARGMLPVFISQPTLWSAGLPPDIDERFWWGLARGQESERGKIYYSPEALGRMMAAFNERLRKVAREENAPLIDMARTMPQSAALFYDEMHYNEEGSRVIAELIGRDLAAILRARGLVPK